VKKKTWLDKGTVVDMEMRSIKEALGNKCNAMVAGSTYTTLIA